LDWRAAFLIGGLLLCSACTPTPTPVPPRPTAPPRIIIETPILHVVGFPSATPTITPVPSATPTLLPQIADLLGQWPIQIDYWVQGSGLVDHIHYTGQGLLTVTKGDNLFTASGSIVWQIIPQEGSCGVTVNNDQTFTAALSGNVPIVADQPTIALRIDPQPTENLVEINASCLNAQLNTTSDLPSLVMALDSAGQLQLTIPLRTGIVYQAVRSLNTLTGGLQRGTLITQIALSR